MAYFVIDLWPVLWPGHNQSYGQCRAGFGTDFGTG